MEDDAKHCGKRLSRTFEIQKCRIVLPKESEEVAELLDQNRTEKRVGWWHCDEGWLVWAYLLTDCLSVFTTTVSRVLRRLRTVNCTHAHTSQLNIGLF
jgi:hypothetical protein